MSLISMSLSISISADRERERINCYYVGMYGLMFPYFVGMYGLTLPHNESVRAYTPSQ